MSNEKFKIIYTLKLHLQLQKRGFKYITEMKNPRNSNLNCWVYEETPEFLDAFNELVNRG